MPKVAICIGHSRFINGHRDEGAVNTSGVSEWKFWAGLSNTIVDTLKNRGHSAVVWSRYQGSGYTSAMRWLAGQIRDEQCDCAVELHFNSSDNEFARGHEVLYWHSSKKGKALAEFVNSKLAEVGYTAKDRGVKLIATESDRGGSFLKLTHCPVAIIEPFFGSNKTDSDSTWCRRIEISEAIGNGIADFLDKSV